MDIRDKNAAEKRIQLAKNALVGIAAGDAFGVPVEFLSRRQVREIDLRDMEGADSELRLETRWGGGIPKGSWSDDTSMAADYIESIPYGKWFSPDTLDALKRLSGKRVRELTEKDIGETGYVVDTLYAALWSMYHAEDFETAIRNAVNLGYDTDTNAAVAGMAAGILYGMEGIPKRWLECLKRREWLESLAADFAREAACL